jgi:tRNA (cmo5U34)-methyltransferase
VTDNWKFDSTVAKSFVDHARQHIPNYDQVINKCVELCQYHLGQHSRIIDVGCATGETLRRLHSAGFTNLTGVDNSRDMLDYCDPDIATILCRDNFPDRRFDAVLCNWTLHFIKDKIRYLADIYSNLTEGGILVLSEKTSLDPVAINRYHNWKRRNGVSDEEILLKEQAVKNIMHIQDVQWYITTLAIVGFKNIQVIDASWCFTTFLCNK